MKRSDIPAAMRVKEFAGWNQTEQDWEHLLRLEPDGCFCATVDGRVVGTATTTTYSGELAWIGMVLVDPEYRRQGIANRLMQTALDYLDRAGIRTIKLDATQAGRAVYERMGFEVESNIERWQGIAGPVAKSDGRPFAPSDLSEILALDRDVFGADRSKLLEMLITDACLSPIVSTSTDRKLNGYAVARRGSNATYIGPLIARDAQSAEQILDCLLQQLSGEQIYVDLNTEFPGGGAILSAGGFNKQRDFDRMFFGKASDRTSRLVFAIAGPELG